MPKSKKIIIESDTPSKPKKKKSETQKMKPKKEKSETQKMKPKKKKSETQKMKPKKPIIILSSSSLEKIDSKPLSQRTTLSEAKMDLKKSPQQDTRTIIMPPYNEQFIELMEKLANIMSKQGEPFRARAYQKAQETIMTFPGDIFSPEDLKGRPNIGPTIMEKLNEYVKTGTLQVLEREKHNPVNVLADVYGIGPKKAKELVEKGITSIEQLRQHPELLNDVQKVGLQYYEDVLKRIPRAEIDEYKEIFEKVIKKPNVKYEIVGSYRRGAQNSGDIDVIITSQSEEAFKQIIDELIQQKIIVEVLSRGPNKCLVMAKIPSSPTIRRVDFLYTNAEEYPFAILYFTGSKSFNTMMRGHALKMGLSMNEHGLYKMTEKAKDGKVDHSFTTEKDIFDYLKLKYIHPEERIDGRQIIPNPLLENPLLKNPLLEKVEQKLEQKGKRKKKSESALNPSADLAPKPSADLAPKPSADLAPKPSAESAPKPSADLAPPFPKVEKVEKVELDLAPPFPKVDFRKHGIKILDTLSEEELVNMLQEANIQYRNFQPIMTDNEYDILEDYIKAKYPDNPAIKQIGAPPTKSKVSLPYFMGSMDKIKPDTNALTSWKTKYQGPYVLSCKLDGVSGLYTTEGKTPHLYTRGDGKIGQDISYLIPYLRLPKTKGLVIRGEFIIPKATFNAKYKATFANPRNMVSGIVNQKAVQPEIMKDVDFVSYELIKPLQKPSDQMATLQQLDINVVQHILVNNEQLTNEFLSELLVSWRQTYPYEIDGVIVTNDAMYPNRKEGNPEHAFAFKMVLSDQIAEAKVVDVLWTPSKDGYLKPRVQIEPIHLGGVKIEYATGFNGSFIKDNNIGIGAVIELIRSGDVIPHIRKVVTPAAQAKMPDVPYKWNTTHVDILLEDIDSDEVVKEKNITGFFRGIEVEGLSSGNIKRIIDAGFDTIPKILRMTPQDFLQVEGFKEKTAQKLYNNIQTKIQSAPLVSIMAASNIFGRGFNNKKLELILESYPDVLQSQDEKTTKIKKVESIKGLASKTAESFVEKIPAFLAFLHEANLETKLLQQAQSQKQSQQKDESQPLYSKSIVFTGFRDKQLEDTLKKIGAKIGSSVSKNTFVLLTKDPLDETGKVLDAKKLGIPIMKPEEFIQMYQLSYV
jgi:NAD-dependent DNA ligase/DNA-binding Lrp family transcriptional regulator